MGWVIFTLAILFIYFFAWSLCKVAGDADRKAEEEYYRAREWDDEDWIGLSD